MNTNAWDRESQQPFPLGFLLLRCRSMRKTRLHQQTAARQASEREKRIELTLTVRWTRVNAHTVPYTRQRDQIRRSHQSISSSSLSRRPLQRRMICFYLVCTFIPRARKEKYKNKMKLHARIHRLIWYLRQGSLDLIFCFLLSTYTHAHRKNNNNQSN